MKTVTAIKAGKGIASASDKELIVWTTDGKTDHADAFPAADVGLLRAITTNGKRLSPEALTKRAEAWRPWRAYAAQHLWTSGS